MIEPDLTGRMALVTGSATGLGRAIVLGLAECGADVAVQYRTSEDAAHDVASAARDHGVDATVVQADVTEETDVGRAFDRIEAELAPVDVLVNNVGAFAPHHWSDIDLGEWRSVMQTNLDGTYLCTRRALPGMQDRNFGRIVNIGYASSDRGLVSAKNFPYFAAKAGVLMFTRMLAADTIDADITVNAVSPYVVENSDRFPANLPRDRPASFADVLQPILFFLDADSDYISGQNVEVSGGWLPERV